MLAFPGMIEGAAKNAGMKVPDDLEDYDASEFPHWHVFCTLQLGSPMPTPDAHWHNAMIVAAVSDDKIFTMSYPEFIDKGIEIGYPIS